MEVGTEEYPYTSKLTITMHGNKQSPEIPLYGNKCIAVRHGVLEMHGIPRTPSWTSLAVTADIGETTISLIEDADWQEGDKIVIAPTGYDHMEAEERTIIERVDARTFVLNEALAFKHYSGAETHGGQEIVMRAEVGLLTRNVVFRGDQEISRNKEFGAHIMLHSRGDESLVGKIENIEMYDVGQAYQLGRYPVHFHIYGTVHKSYVYGNSIYRSYNRAVTFHAIDYLRVQNNVAYNIKGHAFFIEDGIERHNLIEENLTILIKKSWTLLNTDQTPAAFWITNPNNIFRGNHAAGSDRYGFWYQLPTYSKGQAYDRKVCPENEAVGEFSDNVSHSNGRYGLRIYKNMVPREHACEPISDTNPALTAKFERFTSYKNGWNGAIAETVGDVRFIDFKVADNKVSGIEITKPGEVEDGFAQINGGLILGCSLNAEPIYTPNSYGFIAGQRENLTVKNIKFFNFNCGAGMAAIGSCSHCQHYWDTDSGARTTTYKNIYIDDATVPQIIRYQYPERAIFFDKDGGLLEIFNDENGKNWNGGWTVPYFKHNDWQGDCIYSARYDGHVCRPGIQVRRLAFFGATPDYFRGAEMKILQWDGMMQFTEKEAPQEKVDLLLNGDYQIINQRERRLPSQSWAVPFVTDHRYHVHWRNGLDFTNMRVELSPRWEEDDRSVLIVMNHTDIRAEIQVQNNGVNVTNNTLTNFYNSSATGSWKAGAHVHFNSTEQQEIQIAFNGNGGKNINMIGHRCVENCITEIGFVECEEEPRMWSDSSTWADSLGHIPEEGESFEIQVGWNLVFDLEDSPVFQVIENNGCLSFQDDGAGSTKNLNVKHLFNRAGKITIGESEEEPYLGTARITLMGEKENAYISVGSAYETGNKAITNTGIIQFYGINKPKSTRLAATAEEGATSIFVDTDIDLEWVQGDQIGLAPTNFIRTELDYSEIQSYNPTTGEIILVEPLLFRHFGNSESTDSLYDIDIRGEVVLLSRNVQIFGEDVQSWGGQIFTTENFFDMDAEGNWKKGQIILNNVEIKNCSQMDSFKAAIRFENSMTMPQTIKDCSFHHGLGLGAQVINSRHIQFIGNIWFDFTQIGVNLRTVNNVTFTHNMIIGVRSRQWAGTDGILDRESGLMVCAYYEPDPCYNLKIRNNLVVGGPKLGNYHIMGSSCTNWQAASNIANNVAHSGLGPGFVVYPNPADQTQRECYRFGRGSSAYKMSQQGVVGMFISKKMVLEEFVSVDNAIGASLNLGLDEQDLETLVLDSHFYGESINLDCNTRDACLDGGNAQQGNCVNKKGIEMTQFIRGSKRIQADWSGSLPYSRPRDPGAFWGRAYVRDSTFQDFKSDTSYCGTNLTAITLNEYGSDYMPLYEFKGVTFRDVDESALTSFFDAPEEWIDFNYCGNFVCTAPKNVIINFNDCDFVGDYTPILRQRMNIQFSIIANNPTAVSGFSGCSLVEAWNAFYCSHTDIGLLHFDSLDADRWDRSVQPITITDDTTTYSNVLNSMMDHSKNGFYAGQLRLSRFSAMVEVDASNQRTYNLDYRGTPPFNQRFILHTDSEIRQLGVIVRIDYPKAGSYRIRHYDSNQIIRHNPWDDNLMAQAMLSSRTCGENRFIGVLNILEFYLPSGCAVDIEPYDSIQSMVRMDWTLEEYLANGGTTNFIDRLASSLGIHASLIKVVAVYEGSVFVESFIETEDDETYEKLMKRLIELLQNDLIDFGAPIIEAMVSGLDVFSDGRFNDMNVDEQENVDLLREEQERYDEEQAKKQKLVFMIACGSAGALLIFVVTMVYICKKKYGENSTIQIKTNMDMIKANRTDITIDDQHHPNTDISEYYTDPEKVRKKQLRKQRHAEQDQMDKSIGLDDTQLDNTQSEITYIEEDKSPVRFLQKANNKRRVKILDIVDDQ